MKERARLTTAAKAGWIAACPFFQQAYQQSCNNRRVCPVCREYEPANSAIWICPKCRPNLEKELQVK